jgi:ABC-2 type transport system ATP-binding protein
MSVGGPAPGQWICHNIEKGTARKQTLGGRGAGTPTGPARPGGEYVPDRNVFLVGMTHTHDTDTVLKTDSLTKTYVTVPALRDVSLTVTRGESVALLGANGSGKTTLINLLLGLVQPDPPPDGGEARLLGRTSGRLDASVKQRVGLVSDTASPMPWASAYQIARFYRELYPLWDMDAFMSRIAQWELDTSRKLNALSKGQRRLAEIALATSYRPELLLLDEPFNGLDPVHRLQVRTMLRQLREESGLTILYATHALSDVAKLAERVVILKAGRVALDQLVSAMSGDVDSVFLDTYGLSEGQG